MTNRSTCLRTMALIAAMVITPILAAADTAAHASAVTLGPGSDLWIDGTSTIHEYTAHSKAVRIDARRDSAATRGEWVRLLGSGGLRDIVVHVPVASLRSGKAALDKNLRKAMKADRYPEVVFRLAAAPPVLETRADTTTIHATGTLTIAEVSKPITLDARAIRSGSGVWVEGSYALRMSEYGIKPPTLMLGTMRVGDRVTVHYRLLIVAGAGEAVATPRAGQ